MAPMADWPDASNASAALPAAISVPLIKSRLVISLISLFPCPIPTGKVTSNIRFFGDTAGTGDLRTQLRFHPARGVRLRYFSASDALGILMFVASHSNFLPAR